MTAPEKDSPPKSLSKRNLWLIILTAVLVAVGLAWFFWWLFIGRFHATTEDAYVHGNEVMLSTEIPGSIMTIYADDTDLVQEGQIVCTLDPTDVSQAFEMSKAKLANTVRDVQQLFENVTAKEAEVYLKQAELTQYELDLYHREGLIGANAVSLEEFEQAQTNVKVAEAALDYSAAELAMAKALVSGTTVATHPMVIRDAASVREAYINLTRCNVTAPVTGYVAKRSVQVGDRVAAGQSLLAIVPLDFLWGEANFRETKLKHVRIGQPVEFTADIYGGGVKYEGKVVGFSAGTGSAFALLPAQNASGNWIKIIQRLPVRISIPRKMLEEHPLMIGLSLKVNIDVHDTSGPMLAKVPTDTPIYTTSVYDRTEEFAAIEALINTIIETNSVDNNEGD